MDRVSRFINNKKQDKITTVQTQPSVNSMREGQEVLYSHPNGMLIRYRKQNGILWSSNMSKDGNQNVSGNISIEKDISLKGNLHLENLPLFQASRGTSDQNDLAIDSMVLIEFNYAVIPSGHYDTSTYLFTAPFNGYYLFSYNIGFNTFDSGMTYASVQMVDSNNASYGINRIDDKEFTADTAVVTKTATTILHMESGESIGVYYYQNGGTAQVDVKKGRRTGSTVQVESIFTGMLISKF